MLRFTDFFIAVTNGQSIMSIYGDKLNPSSFNKEYLEEDALIPQLKLDRFQY